MKVIVSSTGRFHAFRLAEQLHKNKALKCLFIEDFKRFSDRVPSKIIKGNLRLKLLKYVELLNMFVPLGKKIDSLIKRKKISHDLFVKEKIQNMDADIFVGWSGSCLESLKVAKRKGMKTIVDYGSIHPNFHKEIIREEYGLVTGTKKEIILSENVFKEFNLADFIVVGSSLSKDIFVKEGIVKEKILVASYGVDLNLFSKKVRKDNKFRLIWCGNVSIAKGIHYLLQAFYELDLENSELWLIGAVENEIKYFIKKYNSDKIKILGPKINSNLPFLYSNGSVFVFPSISDGFGLVTLEAMACGLPVIASENVGSKDVIDDGKNGFIVPIRDVDALKEKIKFLYDNPNINRKMSVNASEKTKNHSWENYGKRIINLYNLVLNKTS